MTVGDVRDYRGEAARIRRTRLHPRRSDELYLHLRRLRDDLSSSIEALDAHDVLDIYCGARPYEPLFPPHTHYVGLDIDDAYGCADVVSTEFLPFPDRSFDLCLCTQAFYFRADVADALAEVSRVLRPGGHALFTLPVVYPGTERLYSSLQLRELFRRWSDVAVVENGGTAVSTATLCGYFVRQLEKRVSARWRPLFATAYSGINVTGEALDHIERRFLSSSATTPANLLVRARRPDSD